MRDLVVALVLALVGLISVAMLATGGRASAAGAAAAASGR